MRPILPLLPTLAILAFMGCGTPDEPAGGPPREAHRQVPVRGAVPDSGRPSDPLQVSRWETRRGLESAYDELAEALDSLWRDSLAVQGEMREQYRRILRDAHTAKDNTLVSLDELRVSAQGVTPEIWEEIRARTELSLDSLRRLILSADSTHKLNPGRARREAR